MPSPAQELTAWFRYKIDESGLNRYRETSKAAATEVERAGLRAGKGFETGAARGSAAMTGLIRTARRAIVALGGAFTIRRILEITGEMQQLDAQLREVTTSASEFDTIQRRLFESSQAFPTALEQNTKEFIRFRQSLPGVETRTQLDLFDALRASMAASGTSASRASQLMRRFSRNLAEGGLGSSTIQTFLDGDRRGLEALIAGLNRVAPSLHVTTENIRDLATQGKITSEIVIPAMVGQLTDLTRQANAAPDTFADSMTKLQNSVRNMIRGSDSARGALGLVTRAIAFVADHIQIVTAAVLAFVGAWALSSIFGSLRALIGFLRTVRNIVVATTAAEYLALLPWVLVAAAIAGIILIAQDLYTYLSGGDSVIGRLVERTRSWTGVWGAMRDAVRDLFRVVVGVGRIIGAALTLDPSNVTEAFGEMSNAVVDYIGAMFGIRGASEKVNRWMSSASEAIGKAWGDLGDLLPRIMDAAVTEVIAIIDRIKQAFANIPEAARNAFRGGIDTVKGWLNRLPGVNFDLGGSGRVPVIPRTSNATTNVNNGGNSVTINNNIQTNNPASVERATQRGVSRVFVGRGLSMPSVEAAQ